MTNTSQIHSYIRYGAFVFQQFQMSLKSKRKLESSNDKTAITL